MLDTLGALNAFRVMKSLYAFNIVLVNLLGFRSPSADALLAILHIQGISGALWVAGFAAYSLTGVFSVFLSRWVFFNFFVSVWSICLWSFNGSLELLSGDVSPGCFQLLLVIINFWTIYVRGKLMVGTPK